MTPRAIIGKRISDARKALDLTVRDVAESVGLSHPFISQIENGKCGIPPKRREAFAHVLGLEIHHLTELDKPSLLAAANQIEDESGLVPGVGYIVKRLREMAHKGVLSPVDRPIKGAPR